MMIPIKIDVQVVDESGRSSLIENVLFGLKIFVSDGSWHNYSFFKTDSTGHITLTRQDIIENTEIKWETGVTVNAPTKFELYVWEGNLINNMILMTKRLLELYCDKGTIEQDLRRHGVTGGNIPNALELTNSKAIEDKALYEYIKDAVNSSVKVDIDKIEGVWTDDLPKYYQFVIQ